MGTEPHDTPRQPSSTQEEEAPPFEPDYEIITLLERGRNPEREQAFQRAVRQRHEQRPRT